MPRLINGAGIPLSVAVFLATDDYDYIPNTISATGLIRPIRQTILSQRVPAEENVVDILSRFKSSVGSAVHNGIERAWETNFPAAMKALGYPENVIDRIVVNPKPGELADNSIPVYMEQRAFREIEGYRVSGKFDFVAEGRVEDFKTTTTYTWINGTKDDDYRLQGSIYRWLNPDIITEDVMAIQFMFTDWMQGKAMNDPKYPKTPVLQHQIPLMPLDDTEQYVVQKLREYSKYRNAPEEELPLCSDKELWRSDPVYKYYKNPQKMTRSTKNYSNRDEAYNRLTQDGNVGTVIEVPGQVMACKYCAAFPVCTQKDTLIANGSLQL